MATTYTNLVQSIRDWSNRDAESLPTSVIQQCVRWAADTAYRELEVPPLEYTQEYVLRTSDQEDDFLDDNPDVAGQAVLTTNGGFVGALNGKLLIPADLTAFIQIRISGTAKRNADDDGWMLNSEGLLDLDSSDIRSGIVFNEKTDVRTFNDIRAQKNSSFFWSRQQDNILIAGRLAPGDVIEVLYYRRLPSLDARYGLEAEDFNLVAYPGNAGFSNFVDRDTMIEGVTIDILPTAAQIAALDTENPSLTPNDFSFLDDDWYAGLHIDHWLRDENERILIFGALNEAFGYLQEDDQAQKYLQKYLAEIQELNKEEKRRRASGGNTQVHYNSNLI